MEIQVKSFIPSNKRILVEQPKAADKIGKLYVPDSAQRKPAVGRIVAIAPDVENKNYKINQEVTFGPQAGFEIVINGKDVLMLHELEIFGYYENSESGIKLSK